MAGPSVLPPALATIGARTDSLRVIHRLHPCGAVPAGWRQRDPAPYEQRDPAPEGAGSRDVRTARAERYRTNTPAWPARSRKYCGAMPSTSVTATPTAIAVMVSGDGTATVGPSGRGSLKNISTMTRM